MASIEELRSEAALLEKNRLDEKRRCPRCRRQMEQEEYKFERSILIDVCKDCDLVWLDVGELAATQLAWEESDQGMEANHLRNRHATMTDSERNEFEANISKLPDREGTLGEVLMNTVVSELFWGIFKKRRRRD